MSIEKSNISTVEPIEIGTSSEREEDFSDVKKYISDNYEISKENIFIN